MSADGDHAVMSLRRWRLAASAWALVIVAAGVLPTHEVVSAVSQGHDDLTTTVGHFAAYAVLGFLLAVALGGWETSLGSLGLAIVLAAVLGLTIEAVQSRLPYRDAQLRDAVVNGIGAAVGALVFSGAARALRRRSRRG